MLEDTVDSIQEVCNHTLTRDQLQFIKEAIAGYGIACLMDSHIAKEAEEAACDQSR